MKSKEGDKGLTYNSGLPLVLRQTRIAFILEKNITFVSLFNSRKTDKARLQRKRE